MKNKKAFTLIELLAVVTILGILATISIVSVDKILKDNKEKTYEAQLDTIEDAARTWSYKHINELPENKGDAISIPLKFLQDEGLISMNFTNPKTNKVFNSDLYIDIENIGNNNSFTVVESTIKDCDSEKCNQNPSKLGRKYSENN